MASMPFSYIWPSYNLISGPKKKPSWAKGHRIFTVFFSYYLFFWFSLVVVDDSNGCCVIDIWSLILSFWYLVYSSFFSGRHKSSCYLVCLCVCCCVVFACLATDSFDNINFRTKNKRKLEDQIQFLLIINHKTLIRWKHIRWCNRTKNIRNKIQKKKWKEKRFSSTIIDL